MEGMTSEMLRRERSDREEPDWEEAARGDGGKQYVGFGRRVPLTKQAQASATTDQRALYRPIPSAITSCRLRLSTPLVPPRAHVP